VKPHSNRFMGALHQCIVACGGYKQVGAAIWPNKGLLVAQRSLLNCLNEDRAERLSPDQVMQVLRMARNRGVHVGIAVLCEELSYAPPQPITPQDEAAELHRQFLEAARQMAALAARLEKLQSKLGGAGQ